MLKEKIKKFVVLAMVVALVATISVSESAHALTQAEDNRTNELIAQGYSDKVILDQLDEEFRGKDGKFGTGGIDGKFLNGQPAGSGTSTPTKPDEPQKPAHTHTWEAVSQFDGDCKTNGEITWKCSDPNCGKVKTETLDKGDHDYELTEHTEADCYRRENFVYTCSVCGDSYNYETGELKEHDWIPAEDHVEADCEHTGYRHEICTICGEEITEELPALGHSWSDTYTTDKPATCTTDGEKSVHCEVCGVKDDGTVTIIKAFGHTENPKHDITEPSFWEDGLETVTCLTCGETLNEIVLPKTGGWKVITPFAIGGGVLLIAIVAGIVVIARKKK